MSQANYISTKGSQPWQETGGCNTSGTCTLPEERAMRLKYPNFPAKFISHSGVINTKCLSHDYVNNMEIKSHQQLNFKSFPHHFERLRDIVSWFFSFPFLIQSKEEDRTFELRFNLRRKEGVNVWKTTEGAVSKQHFCSNSVFFWRVRSTGQTGLSSRCSHGVIIPLK